MVSGARKSHGKSLKFKMEMKTIINKSILSIIAYYVNNENGFHSGRAQAMAECQDSSAY